MKLLYFMVIAALNTATPMAAMPDITAKPAGVMIVWNTMKEEFGGFQAFNTDKGAPVCLGLRSTEKGLIEFDGY